MKIITLDQKLSAYIIGLAKKNKLYASAGFISEYSSRFFAVAYTAAGIFLAFTKPSWLVKYLGVPLLLICTSIALRKIIKRPRPANSKKRGQNSFPSNHSASAIIIAGACCFAPVAPLPFIGVMLFCLALLTGLSRVACGLHYPADVLAGFLLGGLFNLLFIL